MVAGETSGDLHGASLLRELGRLNPRVEFFGIGGDEMEEAGVNLLEHVNSVAVVGFTEALRKYPRLRQTFKRVTNAVREKRPPRAILIDYPGFNLRLASRLKRWGVPVTYYICPQLWAWREKRVEAMKNCVDQALCILPFEEEWYHRRGIEANYVGHPLMDHREAEMGREEFIGAYGLDSRRTLVALFPGSRQQEVDRLLPVMTGAMGLLKKRGLDVQAVIGKAPGVELSSHELSGAVVVEETPHLALRHAHIGVIASGTATLEAALYGTPSVVVYKLSGPTWLVARAVTKVPFVSLTNLVAGREILPELLQDQASPRLIADRMATMVESPPEREKILAGLREVKERLGGPGAAKTAARLISERLMGLE